MNPKQRAAEAALEFVKSGMVVGLGTGSTADYFLQAMAAAIKSGRLTDVQGVPTSRQSERRAQHLGIPLTSLAHCPPPDITIDGADEIDPHLDLIKGGGGALLREKIVAQNSRRLVIIADSSKVVSCLGTRWALPVEVVPFCHETHVPFFQKLGAAAALRRNADGGHYVTDSGNYIYDIRFEHIADAAALENALLHRAGVVDCGLFLGIAQVALVADECGVRELKRP